MGFEDVEAQDNLWVSNLLWEPCLKHYLVGALRSTRVVNLMLPTRACLDSRFYPGAREMVILSTLVDKCKGYDMVVVDLPASGHAFSLIDITRSAMGLFRSVRSMAGAQAARSHRRCIEWSGVVACGRDGVNETIRPFNVPSRTDTLRKTLRCS